MIIPQFPRRVAETTLILRPEYIHPMFNREARRKHLRVKVRPYIHVAKNGKIYEKLGEQGDKVIKNKNYDGKFI